MADNGNWCLIESDPGVFTQLIADMGVPGVQVEEIYSLDKASLESLGSVYGLVFLFKFQRQQYTSDDSEQEFPDVFFAKQVISNACATQAILNILFNVPSVQLGSELANFKQFVSDFPPEMKGLAISNSDTIRTVHNSFARTDSFISEEKRAATDSDDLYHFISYVHVNGGLYELDGLRNSPVFHGSCTSSDWLEKAGEVIQKRFTMYQNAEIRFNLMAVIRNRAEILTERLSDPSLSSFEQAELQREIAIEQDKFIRYRRENLRRKHNFIPMILNLVQALAEENKLMPLLETAKAKASKAGENSRSM